MSPKTINCYLDGIRGFYDYLIHEEGVAIPNPVKRGYVLRLSRPLPRYLRDEEIPRLFAVIEHKRDRAMFMLMLRCGLRVEEVAQLTPAVPWTCRAHSCSSTTAKEPRTGWSISATMRSRPWWSI